MSQEYASWAYLNEDGMKEIGDIFPNKTIPIQSIITITFTHPTLNTPETAYLLRGKDLSEEQLEALIQKTAHKFKDDADLDAIRKVILENQMPVRTCLTSGAGTKNLHLFLDGGDDFDFDGEEDWGEDDGSDDFDAKEDWEEDWL